VRPKTKGSEKLPEPTTQEEADDTLKGQTVEEMKESKKKGTEEKS